MMSTMVANPLTPQELEPRSAALDAGRPSIWRTGLPGALLLAISLMPAWTLAQEPAQEQVAPQADEETREVVVEIEKGQRTKLRLALPSATRPPALPPAAKQAVDELEATLRADLEATEVFEIQGPEVLAALALSGNTKQDFVLYQSLNNEAVLLDEIKLEADKLVLEGRVYDLKSGRLILGKRYAGTFDLARRIAHTFSDEVVLYFTGRQGIARTQLAFTSDRDGDGVKELYLMDYDGANQRRISGHRSLSLSPAWSPSGEQLAYVSFYEGPPSLYLADVQTGRKSPLVVDGITSMSPGFSPDGRQVVFARSLDGNTEIFAIPAAGGELRRLSNSGGIDTNPVWSPNGREIAFTSSRSGTPQLYLMDAEGTNARRATFSGSYNDGAAWHPDGTKIAFSYREKGGSRFDVAIVDLVTLDVRIVTAPPGSHEAPTFSPDGRRIAFESSRLGGRQIFTMDAEGGSLRQVTFVGGNFGPAWSNYLK